jgi:hypothetical protein
MGLWSEALLFETAGTPSEDEVRQALTVLRRYREREGREQLASGKENLVTREEQSSVGGSQIQQGISEQPLESTTVSAVPSPQVVTAPTVLALGIDGDFDLGGFVFKDSVPFIHNDGGSAYGNTALGLNALVSATPGSPYSLSGARNAAFGYGALQNNTAGGDNTATGYRALYLNTEGARQTATGYRALSANTTGFGNTATGALALAVNTTGNWNTAIGYSTLQANTEGRHNTAIGHRALWLNGTGYLNTAGGASALRQNTTGSSNPAFGHQALVLNTTGTLNTAIGANVLSSNNMGTSNTAAGSRALSSNTTGSSNTAIGRRAGYNWTTGNNNIALGRGAEGVADESGTIRIGGGDLQTQTFIEGIRSASSTYPFDEAVCTNSEDQLGPCSPSSLRFKEAVEVMGDTTSAVRALRPVTFRFKPGRGPQPQQPTQYGLIAEEVAKVFPTLVSYDDDGKPYTVRYSLLTPLLLNEVQRQEEELKGLRGGEDEVAELRKQMADRDRQLADLRRRLEKLAKKKRFRDG